MDGDPVQEVTIDGNVVYTRPEQQTYNLTYETNEPQVINIPNSLIGDVHVILNGGGGGKADLSDDPAAGGKVEADIQLNGGETLYCYVPSGGGAGNGGNWGGHNGTEGVYNDFNQGGDGGGSAEIRLNSTDDSDSILSGGGGGGDTYRLGTGGVGGGHANEGGGPEQVGDGLVIDNSIVTNATTTAGGANNARQNGSITVEFIA